MTWDTIWELMWLTYNWIRFAVPYPWLTYLHSAIALYLGYMVGQFVLAQRLRGNGYEVQVWTDDEGQRRYFITRNGLEIVGEDTDVTEW